MNSALDADISSRADKAGRTLMAIDVLLTLVAVANGVKLMIDASDGTLVLQAWQTFAFVLFAALWASVVLWPRRIPGTWELLMGHKIAIVTFCLLVSDVPDAKVTAGIDGYLVISTITAYILCKGWRAWGPFLPSASRPSRAYADLVR